jgi:hypothetical protein
MLFKTLIASAALGSALLMPAFADDKRNDTTPERQQWLSIAQIAARLEAAGYRQIEKIEREGGGYEARATNQAGERTKLYINPQTGALTSQHGKARKGGAADGAGGQDSANCNKRRCRDDLPAKPATPTAAVK